MKIVPIRIPERITGEGKLAELPQLIKDKGLKKPIIVTDSFLSQVAKAADPIKEGLTALGLEYALFDGAVPNPTIECIEEGLKVYIENGCDSIVALGGGSPMDCAKIIGARAIKPNKTVPKFKGYFKILKKLPPFFAIPTTAGTGSEATVAAVVSDEKTHTKYPVNDPSLVPNYAILDPALTIGLPKPMTSTTGLDALTHAVEAYVGLEGSKLTNKMAIDATKLIFANIKTAYDEGTNIVARENMQVASFYAGIAFTRAFVGYVHAIAHRLGAVYHIPHGLANAIILPYVLDYFGETAHKKLAELADAVGITGATVADKANAFIAAIRELNAYMDIPTVIEFNNRGTIVKLKAEDYDNIIPQALKESHPWYPVPKLITYAEMKEILVKLTPAQ
jgi:alcohol dehydrogenase class IV